MGSRAPSTCLSLSDPAGDGISRALTVALTGSIGPCSNLSVTRPSPNGTPHPPEGRHTERHGLGDLHALRPAVDKDHASDPTRMLRRVDHDHGGPNRRAIQHLGSFRSYPGEIRPFTTPDFEGGNLERPSAREEPETEDLPFYSLYSLRGKVEVRT